jgi:hypothetical protein
MTDTDRMSAYDLYPDLHNARERLCRAQVFVPVHWKSDLQVALGIIDQAGSALCADRWSRFDQPAESDDE